MDLGGIMLSEMNQRQILYDLTNMWNLRNKKQAHRYREQIVVVRDRDGGGQRNE